MKKLLLLLATLCVFNGLLMAGDEDIVYKTKYPALLALWLNKKNEQQFHCNDRIVTRKGKKKIRTGLPLILIVQLYGLKDINNSQGTL